MNEKILIIEDEQSIASAMAYALRREGYTVEMAYNGEDGLLKFEHFKPDALILDVMMPVLDGYGVLKKMDHRGNVGIIMLTAKEDMVNKVLGLELGADDYITKPFDMRELLARLKSLLRRLDKKTDDREQTEIHLKELVLHLEQRKARVGEKGLILTPKEFDLLVLLVSKPERVYTREQLLELIWGMEYIGGTRTVDIHIQRLRKKLGSELNYIIQTVHGVGYKAIGG